MDSIILFDGACNFCNYSVQFIIKRDKYAFYKFASIQSDIGREILAKYHVPSNLDSLVLIEEHHYYTKSTAALKICKQLTCGWKLLYLLLIIPKPLRDSLYNIMARNRYKWFGKKEVCMLPSPEVRKRFLK